MRRIALLTAAAMAFSTAAIAQPRVIVRDRPVDVTVRPVDVTVTWGRDRYTGFDTYRPRQDFRGRWRTLASGYSSRTQRQFINIGGEGRFRKLRIESTRGQPVIIKVGVEFMDKSVQAVDYNEAFPRGTGEVIDLNGDTRRIKRIIVYTDPNSRGSYSVYGA